MFGFIIDPIFDFLKWIVKMAILIAVILLVVYVLNLLQENDLMPNLLPTAGAAIPPSSTPKEQREYVALTNGLRKTFVEAAFKQEGITMGYDPSYRTIRYPWGDVPQNTGVCTDVIIRAFRAVGIDLQMNIHNDLKNAWQAYPKLWKLRAPDPNIDHRRVPNVMKYLERLGKALPLNATDHQIGDIIAWKLNPNQLHHGQFHIGIISHVKGKNGRMQVIHNAGDGVVVQDVLFNWQIIGRYRYFYN